jgi:hypothetical protein
MAVRQHEGGSCPDTGMGLLRAFVAGLELAGWVLCFPMSQKRDPLRLRSGQAFDFAQDGLWGTRAFVARLELAG